MPNIQTSGITGSRVVIKNEVSIIGRAFQKRNFLEDQSAKLTNFSPDPTKETCQIRTKSENF